MIGRPAVIARFPGVARSIPRMRSSLLGLPTRSRATRSPVINGAHTETGYGNAGAMETTKRFPQRLGNLAHDARFPHSHSRSFVSHKKKTKEEHVRQASRTTARQTATG
jgi:hypothetical protein